MGITTPHFGDPGPLGLQCAGQTYWKEPDYGYVRGDTGLDSSSHCTLPQEHVQGGSDTLALRAPENKVVWV